MLKDAELLKDVALFVGLARAGSFTRAAEQLQVPVSTLSRRIQRLEQGLDLVLFARAGRHTSLTESGQRYLERAEKLLAELRLAQADFEDMRGQASGLLRISMPVDYGLGAMLPLVQEFARLHPDIEMHLDLSPTPADVAAGDVDVALRLGPVQQPNLISRHIGTLRRSLYAAPAYLAERGTPAHPLELARHSCVRVLNQDPPNLWELLHSASGEHVTVRVKGQCATNNMSMLLHLAVAGQGVALLPDHLCEVWTQGQQLQPVLPHWHPQDMEAHALTNSRLQPKRVKLFVNFLVAHALGT
ncbi:MAG: LysR family transcriptional regulator [Rhodoferax sp.]|nr:LysR family transcriptional regulator [Rhodoferax sp.]